MDDIKIFVAHRIDLKSELIENELYVPMYCGAVYAKPDIRPLQGDNIGDNISQKRMSFCEFTVQYWAWKNCYSDYIGLCHYRRYLSFANHRTQRLNTHNMIAVPLLTNNAKKKYGLLDADAMVQEIQKYDALIFEPVDVTRISTYTGEQAHSVQQLWEAYAGVFIEKQSIELLFKLIEKMKPEYANTARAYFSGDRHIGYNCYIMKKELFHQLCEFQFPILFELERVLPKETMEQYPRIIGYMGELLYGVFISGLVAEGQKNIAYKQLVFIEDSNEITGTMDTMIRFLKVGCKSVVKELFNWVCPVGTKRRIYAKRIGRVLL